MSIPPEEDGPFIVDYQEPEKDHAYIPCNNNNKSISVENGQNDQCD